MQQVCLALDAAHSVGVIHRDLKPQNIMRDKTGRVLVMDFGLARTLEGDGMTQTGALVGTMEYMSPEQALAKELDQRSDIFSAGLIFYELLTGQMPYKADSALASLIRRTQERAARFPSTTTRSRKPLSNIVSKCLEREPATRYQIREGTAGGSGSLAGQARGRGHRFRKREALGTDGPLALDRRHRAVVILAVVGFLFRDKLCKPQASVSRSQAGSRAGDSALPQCVPGSGAGLVRREPWRTC